MNITLEPMIIDAEVPFSLDLAGKVPSGGSLSSAAIKVISGSHHVTIDRVSVAGTKAIFWIKALVSGTTVFDVLGTFSDTSDDGDRLTVRVL